jgi:hypothetical protein
VICVCLGLELFASGVRYRGGRIASEMTGLPKRVTVGERGTSRKVVGSRPDEVNDFSNLPNPSGRISPAGFPLPLAEMGTSGL